MAGDTNGYFDVFVHDRGGPPPAVGGIVELRAGADASAEDSGPSSSRDYAGPVAAAVVAAGVIALATGGWYARRRWLR